MAIYHLSVQTINRKKRSAVAASAYRSATELFDERTKTQYDYSRKSSGVLETFLILPKSADPKFFDRSVLWNTAEAVENRKNSNTAREMDIALPYELDAIEQKKLASQFASWLSSQYGVAVDVALHRPDRQGDQRNHHMHLMFTTRTIEGAEFGAKTRLLDVKITSSIEVKRMRMQWENLCNNALRRNQFSQTIDSRSHKDRGLDILPQVHEGVHATAMRRRGKPIEGSKPEYEKVDQGLTRAEYNNNIVKLQTEREPSFEVQLEQLTARLASATNSLEALQLALGSIGAVPDDLLARLKMKAQAIIERQMFKEQWEAREIQIIEETRAIKDKIERSTKQVEWLRAEQAKVKDQLILQQSKRELFQKVETLKWPPPNIPIKIVTPRAHITAIKAHRNVLSMMSNDQLSKALKKRPRVYKPETAVLELSRGSETIKEALSRSKAQNAPVSKIEPSQSKFTSTVMPNVSDIKLNLPKQPRKRRRRRKR